MQKPNILNTPFALVYNLPQMAEDANKFLVEKFKSITYNDSGSSEVPDYRTIISKLKPIHKNYMNTIFLNILENGGLNNFLFIDPSFISSKLPEIFTMADIQLDGKDINTVSEKYQKAWINVAPFVVKRKDARFDDNIISDMPSLIRSIVRAYLCMSYKDSKDWLPPKLATFIIEFYTMTTTSMVSRTHNLDTEDNLMCRVAFGLYMAAMLYPNRSDEDHINLYKKSKEVARGLIKSDDYERLVEKMTEIRDGRDWSLAVVTEIISKLGPERVSKLKVSDLYRMFSVMTSDNISSVMSLDYPPYLVFQILKVLDGGKHPIFNNAVKNIVGKREVDHAMQQLVKDRQFFKTVNR